MQDERLSTLRRHGPIIALAVVLGGLALVDLHYANKSVGWGPDEEQYLNFSRYIAGDFTHVFNLGPAWTRGIQRLHVLAMAPGFALFRSPGAIQFAHAVQVAGFLMAAVPAWLLARGIGTGRWGSVATASLVVLVPWAVESGRFLTEALGYGMFAWALWAIWWATVRPGLGRELLALGVLALTALARSGFLPLLAALPAAALVQTWHRATSEGTIRRRLRRLPAAFLRRRPLLALLSAAGLVALVSDAIVPGGTIGSLAGGYGSQYVIHWGAELTKWHNALARVTVGTGFLPLMFAIPWVTRELLKPRTPETGAFAAACVFAAAGALTASAIASSEERYYMYVAIPLVIGGVHAMVRGRLSRLALATGTVLTVLLFATASWKASDETVYRFAQYPAETFYLRVISTRISMAVVLAVVALAGVYAAGVARLRSKLPLVTLLLVPLLVFQAVQMRYALKKFAYGPGLAVGLTLSQKAWVDRAVPDGQTVGVWGSVFGTGQASEVWREVEVYNTSLAPFIDFRPGTLMEYPIYQHELGEEVNMATGAITARATLPRYVVTTHSLPIVAPEWSLVTHSDYLAADLMRLSQPPRAQWIVTQGGIGDDGQIAPDGVIGWRFFRPSRGGRLCAGLDIAGPQAADPTHAPKRVSFEVTADGRLLAHGSVALGKVRTVTFPLRFVDGPSRRGADVTLTGRGSVDWVGGSPVSIQLAAMRVLPCVQ